MMQTVPFDRFLQDLAEMDVYPDPAHIQEADVAAIWAEVPDRVQESYLSELGLEQDFGDGVGVHLDGSEVVFELDGTEPGLTGAEDHDPATEAASAFQGLDRDALDSLLTSPDAPEEPSPWGSPEAEPAEASATAPTTEHEPLDLDEADEAPSSEQPPLEDSLDGEFTGFEEPFEAAEPTPTSEPEDDYGALGAEALEAMEASNLDAEFADPELAEEDGFPQASPEQIQAALDTEPYEPEESDGDLDARLAEHFEEESSRREVEIYPVYEPYGYVRISYDEDDHQYLYEVIEPELSDREEKILEFIEETIIDVLDIGLSRLSNEEAEDMLIELTDQVIHDYSIEVDESARMRLTYYVVRDFLGFGKLDIIMRDTMIEDISCDGADIPIFLYHRKYESMASTVVYEEDTELDSFVIKLAQRSGKHISIADPLLDARLPDGSRLNATLAREVTASGSTFTIRKFRDEPFTPPDLIRFGTMSPEMLAYFWMAIQHGASMMIAGGTASGKTTALNAVLLFIPPQMKIVSIEDTRELNLPHPNWIPGTTRSGFGPRDDRGHQAGEIDMFQLLKAALRQRPEYITVGEVRGEEATVLFQAMATGHAAYGTMHADSVSSVIHRLEGEPINIPRPLLEALDIVAIQIQTRIGGKRVRRTKELVELVGMDPNTKELLTNEVFAWDPTTDEFEGSGISYVLERIQKENNISRPELEAEMENRTLIIEWMRDNEVRDYKAVAKVVQSYYTEPEKTVHQVKVDLGLEEARGDEEALLDELLDDGDFTDEDALAASHADAGDPLPSDDSDLGILPEEAVEALEAGALAGVDEGDELNPFEGPSYPDVDVDGEIDADLDGELDGDLAAELDGGFDEDLDVDVGEELEAELGAEPGAESEPDDVDADEGDEEDEEDEEDEAWT